MSGPSDADRLARLEQELDAARAEAKFYRTEAEMWKSTADDYAGEIVSLTELIKDLTVNISSKDSLSSGGILPSKYAVNTAPAVTYTISNSVGASSMSVSAHQEVARMIRERDFNANWYNW